ncbi:protein kinase domain-containing protein, partial [Kitasatospora sp. NPDC004240]
MNAEGSETRLVDGRFELLQRLGGGGMGLVWRARDNALHREVALKEVRPPDPAIAAADPDGARELRERVLREARALARLQHPNVVIIHHIVDSAEHPHPWLVMELVSGGSLADRLARGPLSVTEAARLGRGVLSALRAAHAAGIQHRDVKPGNVLLRPDGTPVLTDFGIAAMHGATALTATGSLIGSPEFIAPERIRGEEGNPSSDLWSLGMMLYVAVEGHHPLRRATTLATLAAVLDEPLPPPVRCGPLGPLLSALLARDPAQRPDAEQLDRALAAAESGAPAPGAAEFGVPGFGAAGPGPGSTAFGGYPSGAGYGTAPGHPTASGQPYGQTYGQPYGQGGHGGWAPTAADTPRPVPAWSDTAPGTGHPHADPTGPTGPLEPAHPADHPRPVRGGRPRAAVMTTVIVVAVASVLAWNLRPDTKAGGVTGAGGTARPGDVAASAVPGAAAG